VSGPAAGFLGYRPEQLVGRRVLTVIPERFRQAHVAGMTLHMINGRRPLLDHEVTVPMLHADGTEREATLLVSPVPVSGERMFVAELRVP
jgi:PAS domain S-box-containing protein